MRYPRRPFGPVSLEVPPGLFDDDEAPPGFLVALTALAPATLRIRCLSPGGAACLAAILSALAPGEAEEVAASGDGHLWPGLAVRVPGPTRARHFVFESEGQVFHGAAVAPEDLWEDYGVFLERAMLTIDPGGRPAPSLPLRPAGGLPRARPRPAEEDPVDAARRRLAAAAPQAAGLIAALRFDEAEALIRQIDADIQGAVALSGLYEAALVASPGEPAILARAILWARSAFPEPHAALEAEAYRSAAEAHEARLRKIAARLDSP